MAEHSYPELGGKIVLDTSELGRSIKYLQDSISTIRQQSALTINTIEGGEKSVKGLTQKLTDLNAVMRKQGTVVEKYADELDKLIAKEGETSDKVAAKRKSLADAKVSYANTQTQIKNYTEALEKAQEKEKYGIKSLDALGEKVSKFSPKLGTIISKFADWRVVAGSVATALGVAMVKAVNQGIQAFAEYETAFTNVRKTVDGTEADFETLNAEIQYMAQTMPKSAAEIAEVAALGGQLGVAVDSLGEFTETMIKLGDSTTLTADQAGEMIAQIAAITGMTTSDYERFGSAVVELGNNFATTESKMLETTQRISRFSKSVGLGVEEVLALSTALSALGLESDASGTAMQKIFSQIQLAVETTNEDLAGFAEVAGMSVEEFAALWKGSSMEGFQAFIEGMAALDDAGTSTVATLDKLGINEVRLTSVLQALSSNTETLEKAINMANEAWTENTALTEEASKKYSTYANQVQMTKNTWQLVSQAIGEMFIPVAKAANSVSGELAKTVYSTIAPSKQMETAISTAKDTLNDYALKAAEARDETGKLSDAFKKSVSATLLTSVNTLASGYGDLVEKIKEAKNATYATTDGWEATMAAQSNLYAKVSKYAKTMGVNLKTVGDAYDYVKEHGIDALNATAKDEQIISGLMAGYETYLADFTSWADANNDELNGYKAEARSYVNYLVELVNDGTISLGYIRRHNEQLASDVEKTINILDQAGKDADTFFAKIEAQANTLSKTEEQLSYYNKALETYQNILHGEEQGTIKYETVSNIIDLLITKQKELNKVTENGDDTGTEELTAKYETLAEYIKAYGSEIEKAQLELDELNKEKSNLEELQKTTEKGTEKWDDYAKKSELVNKAISDQEKEINELKKAYAEDFAEDWGDSVASVSKALGAVESEMENISNIYMNKLAAGIDTDEDLSKLMEGLDRLQLFKDELLKVKKELQEDFDVGSYISTYGSDAEKTAYKILTLQDSIDALKADLAGADDEKYKLKVQLAIDLQQQELDEATAEYAELTGEKAGKKWWEAFAEEMSGGSEAYQASTFKQFMQSFAQSLNALGGYVGDISDSIVDNLTMGWDTKIAELDAELDKLSSDAEARTAAIDKELEAKQNEIDERREEGELSEIAYYKASTKAANDAAKEKARIEEETAAKEKQLQAEKNALEEKQFNAEKANSIAQALINGAVAATQAIAQLGPIAGPIAATAMGVLTAWQVAEIAKQQYVPALATGGITTGPTYALIGDNKSGQEAVLPLEDNTMRLLAGKIVDAMERGNSYTYNTSDNDSRQYNITQNITPAKGLTAREIYLQSRKALRDARHY
jgi:TP901 family phage tail tape measure protein